MRILQDTFRVLRRLRHTIYRWGELLRSEKGDPTPDLFAPRDSFAFIVVTKEESLPEEVRQWMAVIRVRDIEQAEDGDSEARADDALAGIFGAREIKRISLAMVEAAFDGYATKALPSMHEVVQRVRISSRTRGT